MALNPVDEAHALQIQAGILGRKIGHSFEDEVTRTINGLQYPLAIHRPSDSHVQTGDPALLFLQYLGSHLGAKAITKADAISTGALATSEAGKQWLSINGASISRCKSDVVVTLHLDDRRELSVGISTKQCNNKTPTNAQLFFTTARGFAALLRNNGIPVTDTAVRAMRQFCGDEGFRPLDHGVQGRKVDPRRYFWEEIDASGRKEWEQLLSKRQDTISRLLFQKAYLNDPFIPEYLIHKTRKSPAWDNTEVAIYSIDELITLSRSYQGYTTRPYCVKKGSFRDPPGVTHLAPRFGVIQMQRGGQAQHPEQLQFNLEAGYFYKIG